MTEDPALVPVHPAGDQSLVEPLGDQPIPVDTYAGRIHVEWDPNAPVTPMGQMAFFIAFLKTSGLFDSLVATCPLQYSSPNAPSKRDVLGTALLSVLACHRRDAHITALRADTVNPPLLGMNRVLSEDAIRRGFERIEASAGVAWLQEQLDDTTRPLLGEPWILDADTTVKPLYGEQEGAVVGYNPTKPGRPSHSYHSFMIGTLRLMLEVEVRPGDQHARQTCLGAQRSHPDWSLPRSIAVKCGAVDAAATMVPHPQRGVRPLSERPAVGPATPAGHRLSRNQTLKNQRRNSAQSTVNRRI